MVSGLLVTIDYTGVLSWEEDSQGFGGILIYII